MVSVNRPRIVLEREQTKDGLRTKPLPMFAKGRNKGVAAYVKWQKRNEAEARQAANRELMAMIEKITPKLVYGPVLPEALRAMFGYDFEV